MGSTELLQGVFHKMRLPNGFQPWPFFSGAAQSATLPVIACRFIISMCLMAVNLVNHWIESSWYNALTNYMTI